MSLYDRITYDEALYDEDSAPAPPPTSGWTLGPLWSLTSACARRGVIGLQRTADGVDGDSDTTNDTPITVVEGQSYYLSFWLRGDGSADGTISFGFAFYNALGTFLSESFIDSTGSPTSWTQFQGNITVPTSAVTAVAIVRATSHLTGTWCVDTLFASLGGGHFVLSSVKHYFDPYSLYR